MNIKSILLLFCIGGAGFICAQQVGLQLGNQAPEINLQDLKGNSITLQQYRGKIVLIDFWASWCAPCRKANKKLVHLYREYHSKLFGAANGFEIYSVSLDHKKESWTFAISDDDMYWPAHVSDLKGWDNEAAQRYHIDAIPYNILINEKGIIIAKNLSEMELMLKLKDLSEQSTN